MDLEPVMGIELDPFFEPGIIFVPIQNKSRAQNGSRMKSEELGRVRNNLPLKNYV
jgi:hypothetical protein